MVLQWFQYEKLQEFFRFLFKKKTFFVLCSGFHCVFMSKLDRFLFLDKLKVVLKNNNNITNVDVFFVFFYYKRPGI